MRRDARCGMGGGADRDGKGVGGRATGRRYRGPPLKVSIVIPAYNASNYIDECISSALAQTHPDTEIIAVDDGSTDGTAEILDGYADRVSVYHKPNGGTASALNYAKERMAGDWFKWLSADDLLRPHAVEALASEAVRLGRRATRCIFYADHDFIDEGGGRIEGMKSVSVDYNHLSPVRRGGILLSHFYGHGITSMFHRSIFDRCGGFDESIGFNEDYEFWLRCCLVHGCEMYYVDSLVASNRVHAAQLTAVHADGSGALKEEQVRERVLGMASWWRRQRHVSALADYRFGPLRVRARRRVRDAILGVLPGPTSNRIRESYLRAKARLRARPPGGGAT